MANPAQQFECGLAFWEIVAVFWDLYMMNMAGMLSHIYTKMSLLHLPLMVALCFPMCQELLEKAKSTRKLPVMPGAALCFFTACYLGAFAAYRAYYWRAEVPTDHLWTSIATTTAGYHFVVWPVMMLWQHRREVWPTLTWGCQAVLRMLRALSSISDGSPGGGRSEDGAEQSSLATPAQQFECGLAFWEFVALVWDVYMMYSAGMLMHPYVKAALLHLPLVVVICVPMAQEFLVKLGSTRRCCPFLPGPVICMYLSMHLGALGSYRAYHWRADVPTDHLWTSIAATTFGYHLVVLPLMNIARRICLRCRRAPAAAAAAAAKKEE